MRSEQLVQFKLAGEKAKVCYLDHLESRMGIFQMLPSQCGAYNGRKVDFPLEKDMRHNRGRRVRTNMKDTQDLI